MLTLVTFDDLKDLLGLDKATLEDYPALEVLNRSVYAAIESYLWRTLEQEEYTDKVLLNGGQIINVRAYPIISVQSLVSEDGTDHKELVTIRNDHVKSASPIYGEATIVYTGGLEETTEWLTRCALLQIAHEWQRKSSIGSQSTFMEGGSVQWPELTLLKEVKRILDGYCNPAKIGV